MGGGGPFGLNQKVAAKSMEVLLVCDLEFRIELCAKWIGYDEVLIAKNFYSEYTVGFIDMDEC